MTIGSNWGSRRFTISRSRIITSTKFLKQARLLRSETLFTRSVKVTLAPSTSFSIASTQVSASSLSLVRDSTRCRAFSRSDILRESSSVRRVTSATNHLVVVSIRHLFFAGSVQSPRLEEHKCSKRHQCHQIPSSPDSPSHTLFRSKDPTFQVHAHTYIPAITIKRSPGKGPPGSISVSKKLI